MENTNNKTIKRTTVYFNEPLLKMIKEIKETMGYTTDGQTVNETIRTVYFQLQANKNK